MVASDIYGPCPAPLEMTFSLWNFLFSNVTIICSLDSAHLVVKFGYFEAEILSTKHIGKSPYPPVWWCCVI